MVNQHRDPAKEAFWREAFKRFAASGQSVREFCKRESVTQSVFYAWRRTIGERDGAGSSQPAFVPAALIGQLYQIERESKELSNTLRLAVRKERSMPVLAKIKTWLDAEQEIVLPRSPMATAITYAQNQWAALTTYTTQGFLNIDNNASERALKRVAIGRKNWLFAGNDAAAENHARLWRSHRQLRTPHRRSTALPHERSGQDRPDAK